MTQLQVGLVLSGGGAKGAYQVGVLKALLELGVGIDVVAGASIGAFNAAILASAPSLAVGVARMEELWLMLAKSSPLKHNMPAYLGLLLASGMTLSTGMEGFASNVKKWARISGLAVPAILSQIDGGLFSTGPLHELVSRYFDPEAISNGLPLYISVFKSHGGRWDIAAAVAAEIGLRDTAPSQFLHIQSLPKNEQKDALLASAAIPVLFAAKQVGGTNFTDGGLGGWQKSQGNTPITPLLQAGINTVIVTHLTDASLWSRHDFPEATILEIRPQTPLERDGGVRDLLGFDSGKIPSWIKQGYDDALVCVGRVSKALEARTNLRESELHLARDDEHFLTLDQDLNAALRRLR